MEPPRSSLNRFVSWLAVLPALGVRPRGAALPARVECPVCHAEGLDVYDDRRHGGQWYHCVACRFSGDSIELASAVTSPGEPDARRAIGWLAAQGVEVRAEGRSRAAAAAYAEAYPGLRARATAYWESCHSPDPLHDSDEFADLQSRFGVEPGCFAGPSWAARGGRFVGLSTRRAFEEAFYPATLGGNDSHRGYKAWGSDVPFRGGGWGPLVVVPFHDLPGRISGFLVAGRAGGRKDVFWYSPGAFSGGDIRVRREAGIALFAALPADPAIPVVVIPDPALAARIQLRHAADSDDPLPLVGTYGGPGALTREAWAPLGGRRLVYWAHRGSRELLAQARASGGAVARALPATAALARAVDLPPAVFYNGVVSRTRTWEAAVEKALARLGQASAEACVADVGLAGAGLVRFMGGCDEATRARLERVVDDAPRLRTVQAGKYHVRETDDGWHSVKRGGGSERLSDATFAVDRVVYQPTARRRVYQGRVRWRGKSTEFSAAAADFEGNPLAWLREFLHTVGRGAITFHAAFARVALEVAQQFHTPETVVALDRVGYDEARGAFVFPNYIQEANGDVSPPDLVVVSSAPCHCFDPPDAPLRCNLAAMARASPATQAFWVVAAHCVATLVASVRKSPVHSLGLVGLGAVATGREAAIRCGCLQCPVTNDASIASWAAEANGMARHDWPILADRRRGGVFALTTPFAAVAPPGSIAVLEPLTGALVGVCGTHHVLESHASGVVDTSAWAHADTIVPVYFRDLCRRRMSLPETGTLLSSVLIDMGEWLERHGAGSWAAESALSLVRRAGPRGFPAAFAALISHAVRDGDVAVHREDVHGAHAGGGAAIVTRGDGGLFIPHAVVDNACARHGIPGPSAASVACQLDEAGLLLASGNHHGRAGWVVPDEWWRDAHRRFAAPRPRKFGVVS